MAIEIEGIDEVLQRIENLADTSQVESAMGRCCAVVEAAAKQNAPKDTGALRNSITSRVENDGEDIVGVVFTPLEYAPYIMCGA